jgi:hypothetical protein
MTRHEHNARHGVNRQSEEHVSCNLLGYGELSQYDPDCAACWLGHAHTWNEHDRLVREKRASDAEWLMNRERVCA